MLCIGAAAVGIEQCIKHLSVDLQRRCNGDQVCHERKIK